MSHDYMLCMSVCMFVCMFVCVFGTETPWHFTFVHEILQRYAFFSTHVCNGAQHASLQAAVTATIVHFQLHSWSCVGSENSKPAGGCPALHLSEHVSDNLVVEPSPCTACSLFMHLLGIHCCSLVCLASLLSSAEVHVVSLI